MGNGAKFKIILLVIAGLLNIKPVLCQDKAPGHNLFLPSDAFVQNGGNIVDITKPPYNAKGDGITDDSEAFIAAYNFIISNIQEKGNYPQVKPENEYIIYIPNGAYLITRTIIYSPPVCTGSNDRHECVAALRWWGQSREKTIIKLKDNCPGFGVGKMAPVLSFGYNDFNNRAARNSIRNFTIDCGTGNPGATGINLGGANSCESDNIKIISQDKKGAVAFDFYIGTVSGFHHNIYIDGFDYAFRFKKFHFTVPFIEHVTLKNQRIASVWLEEGQATFRKVQSINSVPFIKMDQKSAHAVILDSDLAGGSPENPAFDICSEGQIFLRNVKTSGYGWAVKTNGNPVLKNGLIAEYVSGQTFRFDSNSPGKSMNLPIEDVPPPFWSQNPEDFAVISDYPSVQDAFNSGKPIVLFTRQLDSIPEPVIVPATVKRVYGLYTTLKGNVDKFYVSEGSTEPVFFDNFKHMDGILVRHKANRPVVINNSSCNSGGIYLNDIVSPNNKVFLNNCNGIRSSTPFRLGIKAWTRFINTESRSPLGQFIVDSATVVSLTYKTEKGFTSWTVQNGGFLEVLGGCTNQQGNGFPSPYGAFRNINSHLSLVCMASGVSKGYGFDIIVDDQQGETISKLMYSQVPKRPGGSGLCWFLPLYTSYKAPLKVE